jgi:hypothetical protein
VDVHGVSMYGVLILRGTSADWRLVLIAVGWYVWKMLGLVPHKIGWASRYVAYSHGE